MKSFLSILSAGRLAPNAKGDAILSAGRLAPNAKGDAMPPYWPDPRPANEPHQPARRQNFQLRQRIDDILILCRPHQGRHPVMPLDKARHELVQLNTPTPVIERLVVGYVDYDPPTTNRRVTRLEQEFAELVAHRVQGGDMTRERARALLAEHQVPAHIIERTLGR